MNRPLILLERRLDPLQPLFMLAVLVVFGNGPWSLDRLLGIPRGVGNRADGP